MTTGLRLWIDGVDQTCYALPPLTVAWGRDNPSDGLEPRRLQIVVAPAAHIRRGSRLVAELNAPATNTLWMDAVGTWAAQGSATWASFRHLLTVFRGTVTDTDTSYQPTTRLLGSADVAAIAVDPLADLANLHVGDAPFPQETVTQRAQRIEALTPLTWSTETSTLVVAARDIDTQPALGLLDELTSTASIAGGIFYDPNTSTARFMLDATRQSSTPDVTITGCDVLDDAHLAESVADICNDVTVTYVNPADLNAQPEVREVNAASVTENGRRHATISTKLITQTDAAARAHSHVLRYGRSVPRWIDVTLGTKVETSRTVAEALIKAAPGTRLRLASDIDPPAVLPWDGYVEGWELTADAEDWELKLNLSPAAWSGPLLAWNSSTLTGKRWTDADPSWRWIDSATEIKWK